MSLFDRYGIKEVADVTFYEIVEGKPDKPVLYLDTLKVSTIEQTAENTEARGGKGNSALLSWDYGKEITVNLEDALFSQKSLALMYGGDYKTIRSHDVERATTIVLTEKDTVVFDIVNENTWLLKDWPDVTRDKKGNLGLTIDGKFFSGNPEIFLSDGRIINLDDSEPGSSYFKNCPDIIISGTEARVRPGIYLANVYEFLDREQLVHDIEISANSFPGTYYMTADTCVRNEKTGKDELFQIVLPKVKFLLEGATLTMEADGDPSVFSTSIKVLKPKSGPMMQLIQYANEAEDIQEET